MISFISWIRFSDWVQKIILSRKSIWLGRASEYHSFALGSLAWLGHHALGLSGLEFSTHGGWLLTCRVSVGKQRKLAKGHHGSEFMVTQGCLRPIHCSGCGGGMSPEPMTMLWKPWERKWGEKSRDRKGHNEAMRVYLDHQDVRQWHIHDFHELLTLLIATIPNMEPQSIGVERHLPYDWYGIEKVNYNALMRSYDGEG